MISHPSRRSIPHYPDDYKVNLFVSFTIIIQEKPAVVNKKAGGANEAWAVDERGLLE
jgi:hypothetical protein